MEEAPDWLPPLVLLGEYDGVWERYERALYRQFEQDFVDSYPLFRGKRVSFRRRPMDKGKVATFWHLVSEGKVEDERIPDIRRCERIRWPRAIIEHADDPAVKVWENERRKGTRVCLWLEELEYVVVLAKGRGYFVLLTAYQTTHSHTKKRMREEYQAYRKRLMPP